MPAITILGRDVPVAFAPAQVTDPEVRRKLISDLGTMAGLINATPWTRDYEDAFKIMRKIVFFDGAVEVDGYTMTRPGCDQDDAIFYWEVAEFLSNRDDDVHANTFFHDCWHVVQFRRSGNRYANGRTEQVEREVDAIDQQIAVAALLGCSPDEIEYLRNFRDDQARVIARLDEGVGRGGPLYHGEDMQLASAGDRGRPG